MIDKKLHHTHAHTHTTRTKVGGTEDLLMLIPDDTTLDWLDGEAKDLRPHTLTLQVNGGGACKLLGPFDGFEKEPAKASLADPRQTQVKL